MTVAAAVVAAAAGPAGVQAGTWSDPEPLTAPGRPVGSFQLAFDRHGRGLAVWQANGPFATTAVRSHRPGHGWSPIRLLPGLADPQLAFGGGRSTLVGYLPTRSLYTDELPVFARGGAAGPTPPVGQLDRRPSGRVIVGSPVIAGNDRGDAIVAWNRYGPEPKGEGCRDCDDVVARISRAGGPFGPRVLVARHQTLWDLRVAMNARGDAVVAWSNVDYGGGEVLTRVVSAAGRWKRVETVPGAERDSYIGDSATDLAPAIGPKGEVLLAWASTWEPGDINSDAFPNSVYMAQRSLGGRFGRAVKLAEDAAKMDEHAVGHLDATITTGGRGIVAWTEQGADEVPRVRAAVVGAGAKNTTRTLAADPRGAEVDDVAAGPRNQAVILWSTRSRYAEEFDPTLLRASLYRSGSFGPAHTVSSPGDHASTYGAVAAIDPASRRATALWLAYAGKDGNRSRALASSRAIR
jgi:hypothetical protein